MIEFADGSQGTSKNQGFSSMNQVIAETTRLHKQAQVVSLVALEIFQSAQGLEAFFSEFNRNHQEAKGGDHAEGN